ncbi:MAG: hypothetical protein GC154_15715 [bacterium]|nr:hypothetical protein [bacterium]
MQTMEFRKTLTSAFLLTFTVLTVIPFCLSGNTATPGPAPSEHQALLPLSETPTATPTNIIWPTKTATPTVYRTPTPESPTATPTNTPTPTPPINHPPRVAASQYLVTAGVGQTVEFLVGAEDPDGNGVSVQLFPDDLGRFSEFSRIGPYTTGAYQITGTEELLGDTQIIFRFSDNRLPIQITDLVITLRVERQHFGAAMVAQGYGGSSIVHARTVDSTIDFNGDNQVNVNDRLGIIASWEAMPAAYEAIVGGGTDRDVHLTSGDLDGDGVSELVTTFGPVTRAFTPNSANMFIVRSATGAVPLPPDGGIYRTDEPGSIVNYPTGELTAAVGNFIGSATNNQLALAQGLDGNGVIRLIQYNGNKDYENPQNSWDVVGQLFGTKMPEYNIDSGLALSDEFSGAWSQNANRGVSLAAGDLDGDGKDELIVGQTSSPTSRGTIQVLDFGEPNPLIGNVVFDASYFEYNLFDELESQSDIYKGMRGDGGVNLACGDLNGDGKPELIVSSQGDSSGASGIKNWIAILQPVVQNGRVAGFEIKSGSILGAFSEPSGANPSNAVSLGVGEFSGFAGDGLELIAGTQAILSYHGTQAGITHSPLMSAFSVLSPVFDPDGAVLSVSNLVIANRAEGFSAFQGEYEPLSASVAVAGCAMQ